ncbi:TPA: 3-deoxy-D-manno-octulosonic acid transferase, partial [Neisseria meningitidis]
EKTLSSEGGGMQMQARVDGFIAQHRGAGARIAEAVREAVCGYRGR